MTLTFFQGRPVERFGLLVVIPPGVPTVWWIHSRYVIDYEITQRGLLKRFNRYENPCERTNSGDFGGGVMGALSDSSQFVCDVLGGQPNPVEYLTA